MIRLVETHIPKFCTQLFPRFPAALLVSGSWVFHMQSVFLRRHEARDCTRYSGRGHTSGWRNWSNISFLMHDIVVRCLAVAYLASLLTPDSSRMAEIRKLRKLSSPYLLTRISPLPTRSIFAVRDLHLSNFIGGSQRADHLLTVPKP